MNLENSAVKDNFAKYLGIEALSVDKAFARVKLLLKPEFINGAGFVQGGVLFTLADYAFALCANAQDEGLAINSNINFIKAVSLEEKEIYAEAKIISRARKIGTYRITISSKDGYVLGEMTSLAYFKG